MKGGWVVVAASIAGALGFFWGRGVPPSLVEPVEPEVKMSGASDRVVGASAVRSRSMEFEELVALLDGVGREYVGTKWRVRAILKGVEGKVLERWLSEHWLVESVGQRWKWRACCELAMVELVRRNPARARGFVGEMLERTDDGGWEKALGRIDAIERNLSGPVRRGDVVSESDGSKRREKLQELAEVDPEGALQLLKEAGEGAGSSVVSVADRVAWSDPGGALEAIEGAGLNERTRFVYLSTARLLALSDPASAVERFAAKTERNDIEEKALQVALQTWVERDVDAVVEYLGELDDGEAAGLLLGTFGVSGYGASGAGVTGAFSGGFYGEKHDTPLVATLGEKLLGNPEVIGALAERFAGTDVAAKLTNSVLENLARTDPEGALVLALESEGDGNLRSSRVVSVVGAVAESDPEAAMDLVMQVGKGETGRTNGLGRIAGRFGESDPVVGVAMLERLEGGERDWFFGSLNFEVSKRDPHRAAELFDTYLDGESGDGMRNMDNHAWQLANSLVRVDPPAALEWAVGLPEGKVRERALREVREEWGEFDREGLAAKERELGVSE